ncbi:MAG: hypothetical protein JWO06_3260 [Bacteroidota bacterium]|nr:hypothetical protein [Bacteroidota bacterium]
MKKIFLVWCAVFLYTPGQSQMYDAQWVLGPLPSTIDFGNNTITNHSISDIFSVILTNANICDSSGNLLLITNGINLYDKNGDSLSNGNGLSPCPYSDMYANEGLNSAQAALFIPAPGKPNLYYLLHMSDDTLNEGRPGTLYYTLIDGSNGYGTVLEKNIPFCKGIFTEGGITGCKHANGRDYWIIKGCHNSNTYFKFLLTPDTILGPFIQSIGPNYSSPYDYSCSKFSEDGSKFVTGAIEGLVAVMDFNRCTGELSNALTMYNEASTEARSPLYNRLRFCRILSKWPVCIC